MEITILIETWVQCSECEWRKQLESKTFSDKTTLKEIIDWQKTKLKLNNPYKKENYYWLENMTLIPSERKLIQGGK